jgi:hypothetical protein
MPISKGVKNRIWNQLKSIIEMVCKSCELKYGTTKLITGSIKGTVDKGPSSSTAPGGVRNGKNKLLGKKPAAPYSKKCRDCKGVILQDKALLCTNCAYKKVHVRSSNYREFALYAPSR